MKQKLYFVLAVVFALVAAGGVYLYMENLEQETRQDLEYGTMLVTRDYIPMRTVVTSDMLETKEVPLSQVRNDALKDKDEIAGSITKTPFYPGEPFLQEKLASPGDAGNSLSYNIASGKRAVSVAVNEVIGVGYMVLPGDRVDVIVVMEKEETTVIHGEEGQVIDREEERTYTSEICAQDLKVLAVNQTMAADQESLEATTVTLEVSPDEAQKLVLADERGVIRLLLREATDTETVTATPLRLDDF